MRLLLWVLLVTLAPLLSSANATNPDKKQVLQLNSGDEVAQRVLATGIEDNSDQRLLRGEVKKTDPGNDEDRAFLVKFKGSIENWRLKFREWNPFSTKNLEKRFEKLAEQGVTPDFFKKDADQLWYVGRWKRKVYKRYLAWYTAKYPNWQTSLPK